MQRIILSILCFIIISSTASAQKQLKGHVFDAGTNAALSGASVSFGGKGTTTDANGDFTVDCSKSAVITVSFVGYEKYTQTISDCNSTLNIGLHTTGQTMDAVEITATSSQNKSLLYQPQSITKLSTVELKRGNGLFFDDAINGNVPGMLMQRRAVSSGQQFNIRGYGNGVRGTNGVSSNFDGQGYKVYLNGIPITDAEGITTMDDIDFGSIGNVEVTKGPAGTLYGLAISGAVNLHTIVPEQGKTSIAQDILVGNYGLQRYTTNFMMGTDKASILLNYGKQKSDGFTIHNASHKDFVNAAGNFQPNARQSVSAYFGYSNSYDERNGEDSVLQYERGDYTGNLEYIKRNGHSAVITFRAGLSHTYNFNSKIANTTTVFGTAFNSNASSAAGWTDKASTNLGLRTTFDTKFSISQSVSLSGITGLEIQRQNASTIGYNMIKNPYDTASVWTYGNPYYYIIGGTAGSLTANGERSNVYTNCTPSSVFTDWTLSLPKDISISAGLGLSTMKISLDDRFYDPSIPKKVTHFDTTYKGMVATHLAVNKVINKQISVYAAYSSAYKAPVSSYFYIPAVGTGSPTTTFNGGLNSNLKPERGDQIEIGSKGNLLKSKLDYQVAFFDVIYSNKMTTVAVPNPANTVTLYTYIVNGGKLDNKGIEAAVKYTAYKSDKGFLKAIVPFANLTYSDFKYKDYKFQTKGKTVTTPVKDSAFTTDYSGNPVACVPKVVANLGFDVTTNPGLYFNMTYFYKDGMPITSDGLAKINGVNIPYRATSYSLLNAKIGFQRSITKHFDINAYFAVNNITNTKYPIMVFANQIPDAYLVGPVKANYFGGLNLKYNF